MSKTKVIYKDVAPFAEADATTTTSDNEPYTTPAVLPTGLTPPPLITLERNRWLLDGGFKIKTNQPIAFWSTALSDGNGEFATPPVIDVQFTMQHTSTGISLIFDTATGEYCSLVNIKWYQGDTLLADADFQPDSATYFCKKTVNVYTHLVITLKKTNRPFRRARLNRIVFGISREFDMTDIRSATIVNESDLSSIEVPISTMDLTVDSHDSIDYIFQLKQPMEVLNDDKLIGVYYIDKHARSSQTLYELDLYDAWGVLDETMFPGKVYTAASMQEALAEIVGPEFDVIFDNVADVTRTGIIESCTRRQAAQQILFSAGWVATTDGQYQIRVFVPGTTPQEIPIGRTYVGAKTSMDAIVTEVQVSAHSYEKNDNGSIELNGERYVDNITVYTTKNPNVAANDKKNLVQINDATLVSPDIGQEVAQRVYDYYLLRRTDKAKVVWTGERLEDYVRIPTAWGDTHEGHIEKMTITLSNTVAADVELTGA